MTRPARCRGRRRGLTVLELMIALGLLGALLAVAWSILGSYRAAEQRGWRVAYRMQVVRATREMLASDAGHWVASASPGIPGTPLPSADTLALVGDGQGFTVAMLPSISPLPWVEQVTADEALVSPGALAGLNTAGGLDTAGGLATGGGAGTEAGRPLGPRQMVKVSYRLFPAQEEDGGESSLSSGGPMEGALPEPAIGTLSSAGFATGRLDLRRQIVPLGPNGESLALDSDPDRLLTIEDLYRVDEDERRESGSAIESIWVRELVAARFRYSDGNEWRPAWDGRVGQTLPAAIELSFNHPVGRGTTAAAAVVSGLEGVGAAAGGIGGGDGGGDGASEPDLEPSRRDVRLVIRVPGAVTSGGRSGQGSAGISPLMGVNR